MASDDLKELARQFLEGQISGSAFLAGMGPHLPERSPDTNLDLNRAARCGFPEVIFGQSKTIDQLRRSVQTLLDAGQPVLVTRMDSDKAERLTADFPDACYNPISRTLRISQVNTALRAPHRRTVGLITAGTSDEPVAQEAQETLNWMGVGSVGIRDVGVAGPHRLPARVRELDGVAAAIVVAGMEGALPSAVGGYLPCPVIAVPTSVGYGASFGGVAALLGMLNSCAANVTVVNIDAGFKAGYIAGLIATSSPISPADRNEGE